jgi:hypothetical protein
MLDIISNIVAWFFLISGVLAWSIVGLLIWFYSLDRR